MHTRLLAVGLLVLSLLPRHARADDGAPDKADTERAREAFARGLALAREQRWGEALEAFEVASAAKPHALTTYNTGVAERALGRYTRARVRIGEAVAQNQAAGGGELSPAYVTEAGVMLGEIDRL